MQFDIVIAHYKENIEWLNNFNNDSIRQIVVYNKAEESQVQNNKIVNKFLPNIGREAHTYLTYCVEYYNNLPDFTIFLQAIPHHGINTEAINNWIGYLKSNTVNHTDNYKLGDIDWFLDNGRIYEWAGEINQSPYDVYEWSKIYIRNGLIEKDYPIFWNACFGVSKKAILSNSVLKYQKILNEELQEVNSAAAHYLERLWYYLFNLDLLDR